ncbi:hypothetical protein DFJ74DRAFT_655509 [Hyaloraphidium curvatum]|nr:hypothetical protein DFJ74DRAFT_655509 [Hyaloraphidium curvatum]
MNSGHITNRTAMAPKPALFATAACVALAVLALASPRSEAPAGSAEPRAVEVDMAKCPACPAAPPCPAPQAPPPLPPAPSQQAAGECAPHPAVLAAFRRVDDWSRDGSGCPTDALWDALAAAGPPPKALVNVGCNRGYNLAGWLGRYAPAAGIVDGRSWLRALEAVKNTSGPVLKEGQCGACGNCREKYGARDPAPAEPPRIACMDAAVANVGLVNRILAHLGLAEPRQGVPRIDVSLLAFAGPGPANRTLYFPRVPEGDPRGILGADPGNDSDPVPVSTVDEWHARASAAGFPGEIDLLEVDAEGLDPAILRGAAGTLSSGAVRAVLFEHNTMGQWTNEPLKRTVDLLEGTGMACYLLSKRKRVWRIGGCDWIEDLGKKRKWANVMCFRRGDPWHEMVEGWNVTPEKAEHVVGKQTKQESAT